MTPKFPRSLNVLCGDAWAAGYQAALDDLHHSDGSPSLNPYLDEESWA